MLRDREDGRPNNVSQGFTGRFFFTIVFLWEKPLGSHGVFFFFLFVDFSSCFLLTIAKWKIFHSGRIGPVSPGSGKHRTGV